MNATPYMRPDQKPFPDLKNMSERETFYRYDLPDGSAIVVRSYPYIIPVGWGNQSKERTGQVYYLLELGEKRHFDNCKISMTELKEYLTRLRKEKR